MIRGVSGEEMCCILSVILVVYNRAIQLLSNQGLWCLYSHKGHSPLLAQTSFSSPLPHVQPPTLPHLPYVLWRQLTLLHAQTTRLLHSCMLQRQSTSIFSIQHDQPASVPHCTCSIGSLLPFCYNALPCLWEQGQEPKAGGGRGNLEILAAAATEAMGGLEARQEPVGN